MAFISRYQNHALAEQDAARSQKIEIQLSTSGKAAIVFFGLCCIGGFAFMTTAGPALGTYGFIGGGGAIALGFVGTVVTLAASIRDKEPLNDRQKSNNQEIEHRNSINTFDSRASGRVPIN